MKESTKRASQDKAKFIAFPEMAYFIGTPKDNLSVFEEWENIVTLFTQWAREFSIDILCGSIRKPVSPTHCSNTAIFISSGSKFTQYQKIFLFKARLDHHYDEARYCKAGDEIVVLKTDYANIGLSVCYDLRFPELFRSLRKRHAQIILLPACFTVPTGSAHWHTLLRARAIENQCFMVAPAQVGKLGDNKMAYGHSLVVSPWGEILLDMKDEVGVKMCELSLATIDECKKKVDVWRSLREDLFPIP